jgi:Spy/CpxP family protein refolding chaperone
MPREAEVNMQRNGFFWGVALLLFVTAPVMSAEPERSRPPVPEELSESWERFQRALHEWGGRMWERLGPRGAREDRPVISQMLNNKEALGLSSDQVRRLEQLRDNFQRQTIRNEADLRIMELDIAALLDSEPVDMTKLETKMREEEKLRTDLRIARIRAIEQGKALLNADQKKKLTELMRQSLTLQYPKASQNPSATERGQPSR